MQIIFTDGNCSANGYNGAKAGCGVYFGPNDSRNISCPLPGKDQTNNRAEAYAVILALQNTDAKTPVEIRTDSLLTINVVTRVWVAKKNLDLINQIWQLLQNRQVAFTWIKGHNNEEGNEMADKLATNAIGLHRVNNE